jgi:Skp family chaperone for outer membrane proteins
MKISRPAKRATLVILIFHTLAIIVFTLLGSLTGALSENPLMAAAFIVMAAALIFYAANLIAKTVDEEFAGRLEALSKSEAALKALSAVMENSAKELARRSEIMKECQRELEHRAAVMDGYSDKMTELIAALNAADDEENETMKALRDHPENQ